MTIPLVDLKLQYSNIKAEVDAAVRASLDEANFILGPQVKNLEDEIARYCGTKFAVGVASGTDALVLALAASGITAGDEVITTPFTFIATAEAISRVGAKPVFCDIDPETYNIAADQIEAKITKNTKAILPVHLYGCPCAMDKILALAGRHKLKVIEDCAQSFGAEFNGKQTGSIGDVGCYSFFPGKNLGCYGDGGMVVTNDAPVYEKLKMLRNHGSTAKYYYGMHGYNSRLDTLQAAILNVKLKHIDGWIDMRIANAGYYSGLLKSAPGIILPHVPPAAKHSFNYYTIRMKKGRAAIQEQLKADGIACAIYYPLSLHVQEVYKELGCKKGDFPVAEQMQDEVLSLPMYPELSKAQIEAIAGSIKKAL